jgi:hypothetical protein
MTAGRTLSEGDSVLLQKRSSRTIGFLEGEARKKETKTVIAWVNMIHFCLLWKSLILFKDTQNWHW